MSKVIIFREEQVISIQVERTGELPSSNILRLTESEAGTLERILALFRHNQTIRSMTEDAE